MFKIQKNRIHQQNLSSEKSLVERLAVCASQYGIFMNALVAQCCEYALEHGVQKDGKQL